MSKSEVTQRLMCSEAKVESQRLRTGKLSADDQAAPDGGLRQAREGARLRGRYLADHDDGDPLEGAALKAKHPDLGLIIVDYLQLMIFDADMNPSRRSRRSRAR